MSDSVTKNSNIEKCMKVFKRTFNLIEDFSKTSDFNERVDKILKVRGFEESYRASVEEWVKTGSLQDIADNTFREFGLKINLELDVFTELRNRTLTAYTESLTIMDEKQRKDMFFSKLEEIKKSFLEKNNVRYSF